MSSAAWVVALAPLLALGACLGLYPIALHLAARRSFGRPDRARSPAPQRITVIVTCHNECTELQGAIESVLAQDALISPQIIIASDASTDDTDTIAIAHASAGVTLHRHELRAGKTGVENSLAGKTTGDVIFFMDAASRPAPEAFAIMLRAFEDADIGVVSSRDASPSGEAGSSSSAEGAYLKYEMWLRDMESRTGGIVGASGSLYAMRRALFIELAPHTARDFASVLLAQHLGLKAISAPASCVVRPATDLESEQRRRSRTMAQGMATLLYYRAWLHPLERPGFAIKLFCHKVARWLVLPAVLFWAIAAITGAMAASTRSDLRLITWGTALLAGIAAVEFVLMRLGYRSAAWLGTAAAAVLAGLVSWKRLLAGERTVTWEPTRR